MKEGWKYAKVGQIFDTYSGGTPLKSHKEYYENGNIPWLCSGEVCRKYITSTEKYITQLGLDNSSAKYYPENTVVVAMYGATAAQVGILKCRATSNQAVCGILPNDKFLPEFVYNWFLFRQTYLASQAQGGAQPNISQIKIKNIEIPVLSLSEQQQIVDFLDAEFAKIDKLKNQAEQSLQNAKDLFQAALKEMLTPKEGWKKVYLKDISTYFNGLTYKPDNVSEEGTIVLRSSNIQNDYLDLKDIVRVNCPIKENLYVEKGDVLMCSRNGSARLVGKVALLQELPEKMTFGTFMMIIKSEYNPFLFYFFKSEDFRNQIKHGEANMINQITRYMLNDVILFLPEKEEITKIVSSLQKIQRKVDALQSNYTRTIQLCADLKQALLRQVFE